MSGGACRESSGHWRPEARRPLAAPPLSQYWEPGRDDTFMTDPVPVCAAPGARLNVSVRLVKDFGGALGPDDWYMDGVWLTLSRVPPDSRTDQARAACAARRLQCCSGAGCRCLQQGVEQPELLVGAAAPHMRRLLPPARSAPRRW